MVAIPKTTLYDRVSGKVTHGDNPEPKPYHATAEEKEMAKMYVNTSVRPVVPSIQGII